MDLLPCPRCEEHALIIFEDYWTCQSCNLNSLETEFNWDTSQITQHQKNTENLKTIEQQETIRRIFYEK